MTLRQIVAHFRGGFSQSSHGGVPPRTEDLSVLSRYEKVNMISVSRQNANLGTWIDVHRQTDPVALIPLTIVRLRGPPSCIPNRSVGTHDIEVCHVRSTVDHSYPSPRSCKVWPRTWYLVAGVPLVAGLTTPPARVPY